MKDRRTLLAFLVLFALAIPCLPAKAAVPGDLVKGSLPAVYYVAADGKRMPFPNEAAYFSWYADFSGVRTVSDEELAELPLASLVTIRPGTKIVKFESSPKAYAVAHGGTLRWLATEDVAKMVFGADWPKKVSIVPDAFLTAYKYGTDITAGGQYWWAKERDASPDIAADLDPLKSPDATPVTAPPPAPPAADVPVTAPVVTEPAKETGPEKKNVLMILWDPKRPQHPAPDKAVLERVTYGAVPSAADYYKNESNDKVNIVNAGILGWYSADKSPEHYWSDDALIHDKDGFKTGAAERVYEAIKKADSDFDFKKYDIDGDGSLKPDELAVFVVIPESGDPVDSVVNAYSAEDPSQQAMKVDGVTLASVGELHLGNPLGEKPKFGAIIHCFAKHIFGLQDISGAGAFSLLSTPHADLRIDPYNRIKLGWVTPKIIPKFQEVSSQQLISIETSRTAIRIDRDQPNGPALGSEYFLIENRERGNYDTSLPDTGLAIWDVNSGNVTLVRQNKASSADDTRALWHLGSDPTAFISRELSWADNARSGVRLLNLGYPDPVMNFTLEKKIMTAEDLIAQPSPIR